MASEIADSTRPDAALVDGGFNTTTRRAGMPLSSLARRARLAVKAFQAMGLKRTTLRVRYELAHRSGWLARRYPASELSQWTLAPAALEHLRQRAAEGGLFLPLDRSQLQSAYRRMFPEIESLLFTEAERFVGGEMEYFSHHWEKFDAKRDWFRNPFTDQVVDWQAHWTHVAWDAPGSGDLKFQLEPARFAWVFKLARAYIYSGDEKYAAAFWRLFDGWCEQNPPQAGPLWICGQESSLRLMAMVFGLFGFSSSSETTDERFARLAAMIAAHADRALGTTVYARSQQNNHALSEGTGLLTAGLVLADHPAAEKWRRVGHEILEEQVPLQIYVDGGYTQHSHNYHRVMLDVLTWAVRISEHHGQSLSKLVYDCLAAAAHFLREMLDPTTGKVPNYGHNDGALVLPLSVCPYDDFRPAVQAASWAGSKTLPLGPGAWNEELFWLAGPSVVERVQLVGETETASAKESVSINFPIAGYDVLRGRDSWAMIRAAQYHDRPGQADQLHLDVWWRGINVACDAGTFLYNGQPPWQNALAATAVHNTVTVDGLDQMTRAGRFFWVDWAQAKRELLGSPQSLIGLWRGTHDGYRRLDPRLDHVREVLRLGDAHWLVLDSLRGERLHTFRLHWLVPNLPHQWDESSGSLQLDTPEGKYEIRVGSVGNGGQASLVVGDANSTCGWRSRYYGDREMAISLALETSGTRARFWTLLGPAGIGVAIDEGSARIVGVDWQAEIAMDTASPRACIRRVEWKGQLSDELTVRSEW